jgi:hypothetical protein
VITKAIWEDYKYKNENRKDYSGWYVKELSNSEVAFTLLMTILLTPISTIIDLIILPFEILYMICYKIVVRGNSKC